MMFGENPGARETASMIPVGSVGAELGVWKGRSSELFVKRASHVHLVDSWAPEPYKETGEWGDYKGYLERYSSIAGGNTPEDFQAFYDRIYKHVVDKFKGKPVTIHRMTTDQFFEELDEDLDWIYVDASHAYEQCLKDLRNSLFAVKSGGLIFGDDYSDKKPEVKAAVNTFAFETKMTVDNFFADQYRFVVE